MGCDLVFIRYWKKLIISVEKSILIKIFFKTTAYTKYVLEQNKHHIPQYLVPSEKLPDPQKPVMLPTPLKEIKETIIEHKTPDVDPFEDTFGLHYYV